MNVLFEFIISRIYMQVFFHLISWGKKMSEMAQQVCCGFCHFRDMRGPMGPMAKILFFFKSYFNGLKFNTVPCVKINEFFFF